jgi:hypothetical protein
METKEQIQKAYTEYVLEHGRQPVSVFSFANKLNSNEQEFYKFYNSFEGLEQDIWKGFFERTKAKIESQDVYMQYSVREKLLSFYYTFVEELKANRSFIYILLINTNIPAGGFIQLLLSYIPSKKRLKNLLKNL